MHLIFFCVRLQIIMPCYLSFLFFCCAAAPACVLCIQNIYDISVRNSSGLLYGRIVNKYVYVYRSEKKFIIAVNAEYNM